jgi:hypothetical protein
LQFATNVSQLIGSANDANRDGKIEAAAFLGQIGGSQVDSDAPGRELELGVCESRTHAVLAFPHGGFRKSDDVEGWEPGAYVDFHPNLKRVDSALFPTKYGGDRHKNIPLNEEWRIENPSQRMLFRCTD